MSKIQEKYVFVVVISLLIVFSQLTFSSANQTEPSSDILVCINKKSGQMRKPKALQCKASETPLTISMQGAQGIPGVPGVQGPAGPAGPAGQGFEYEFVQSNGNKLPWPFWNVTSSNWNRWANYTVNFVFDIVNGRPRFISQSPLHADYSPSKSVLYTDRSCTSPAFLMLSKDSLDRQYEDYKLNVIDSSVQFARYNAQPMYVSDVYRARVTPDEKRLYFLQVNRRSNLPTCHQAKWDLSQYYSHFLISELKPLPNVLFPLQMKPAG